MNKHLLRGEFFEKNGWELVETPKTVLEKKKPFDFCSWWLNMNTLVLDPKTVCVEASEAPVMELLDKHGFEVVPVPFYDVSAFGGFSGIRGLRFRPY
jgi:glycine amidinotransferase